MWDLLGHINGLHFGIIAGFILWTRLRKARTAPTSTNENEGA